RPRNRPRLPETLLRPCKPYRTSPWKPRAVRTRPPLHFKEWSASPSNSTKPSRGSRLIIASIWLVLPSAVAVLLRWTLISAPAGLFCSASRGGRFDYPDTRRQLDLISGPSKEYLMGYSIVQEVSMLRSGLLAVVVMAAASSTGAGQQAAREIPFESAPN